MHYCTGRDAATDEDEDDVDATEAAASSTDPLQASAVADAASTTRADQVPDVEEQPEPSDYTHAIPRTLDFDTSTAADRAPASGVPQAPSTNDHSQAAATDHSDSSDAEMAPAADTDQGPSADRGSHAATNTDQASSSEAAQNSIENQEYADAPAPDTDDAKQSAYRHAGIKLSVIQGDQEAQQANTAGETTSGGGHTDAAPEDKPSTSMAAESVPEDSRSAYEHADAKLAAIQGAGHNEQPETSHGDVDTSTKQAEAPPVNTEAGTYFRIV